MFRASGAHLQEDTVVYMQHMILSLSMRVPGGLSVHSLSDSYYNRLSCLFPCYKSAISDRLLVHTPEDEPLGRSIGGMILTRE